MDKLEKLLALLEARYVALKNLAGINFSTEEDGIFEQIKQEIQVLKTPNNLFAATTRAQTRGSRRQGKKRNGEDKNFYGG